MTSLPHGAVQRAIAICGIVVSLSQYGTDVPSWDSGIQKRHRRIRSRWLRFETRQRHYTGKTMKLKKSAVALCLALSFALPLTGQTTATTRHTPSTAHRSATTAGNPADHPPGVPPVHGLPKPLYSLRYIDILVGEGALAEPQKFYTVRYTGWTTDGKKFDSSDDHPGKEPYTFPYGAHRVIIGWDTGFEGMRVGGKRRLFVPYELAYGELGRPPIPAKADLIFDIELVAQSDAPPTPPTAPATPTPPATAKPSTTPASPTTPSGQPVDPTKPTTVPSSPGTTPNPSRP